MIITCPSCDAQYVLPEDAIGPNGRRVKCTSCSYIWLQPYEGRDADSLIEESFSSFQDDSDNLPKPAVQPTQITFDNKHIPLANGTIGARMAVAASVFMVLVLASAGFLYMGRVALTGIWPPLALLYETARVPVSAPGSTMVFENVNAKIKQVDDKPILNLEFDVKNPSSQVGFLPNLLVRVTRQDIWLKDWHINLNDKYMPSGEMAKYAYQLADAPLDGEDVMLRFTD